MKKLKIAYLSTWPPEKCGIGTFAYDLADAVNKGSSEISWHVIVLKDPKKEHRYDSKVIYKIDRTDLKSFFQAANFVNQSALDLLVIQHEFNLYGKHGGARILPFLEKIRKPIIVIFHCLPDPTDRKYSDKKQKIKVANKISSLTTKVVVFCSLAKKRLVDIYKVDSKKVVVIPHGSPEIPKEKPKIIKEKLGFSNNIIILNFGFIVRRKGLETIIKAMPSVIKNFPSAKLVLVGGGHPPSQENFENYLKELKNLSKKLKIEKNVLFVTGFIPVKRAMEFIKATDIFVCMNTFKSQISSGPLAYGIATGKAIVSSSFTYAEDVLSGGRGLIVPIGNYKALSKAVCKILADPWLKKEMERKTFRLGKAFLWKEVAKEYIKLFHEVIKK